MEDTSTTKLGIPFLLTLLFTISLPSLYLIGYSYARSYYSAFDNAWIVEFLSFHEILSHSLTVGSCLLLGFLVSLTFAHHGYSYRSIMISIFLIVLIMIAIVGLLSWHQDLDYLNNMLMVGLGGLIAFIGSYVADLFTALKNTDSKYLKFSIEWCFVGALSITGLTSSLGSIAGSLVEVAPQKKFPKLVSIHHTEPKEVELFLAGVMNNEFLILERTNGVNSFRAVSNLDQFKILPVPRQKKSIPVPRSAHPTESYNTRFSFPASFPTTDRPAPDPSAECRVPLAC